MDTETKTNSCPKVLESLPKEEETEIRNVADVESCPFIFKTNDKVDVEAEKDANEIDLDGKTFAPSSQEDIIEVRIWRNNKIRICKPLIPLRIAQCLWFGGGRLKAYFFSVIMKQRGLTVVEFSSVFSLMFLFQFSAAYISGIIADKLGNAKHVLIFHMLASFIVIICILLAPNISNNSCLQRDGNIMCSDILGNNTNLEYCNYTCLENCTKKFLIFESDEEISANRNFCQNSILLIHENETVVKFSVSLNGTDALWNNKSSMPCLIHSQYNCSATSAKLIRVLYAILILAFFSFWSTTYRFLDFIALCLVQRSDSHFGKERSYAMLGEIIMTTLATFVLNFKTSSNTKNDYDSMYWISAAVTLLALISVCNMKAVIFPPGRKLIKKSFKLIKDIDVAVFILVLFVTGNAYSFTSNYHSWFLDSLNASKATVGFNLMSFSVYGFPALLTSKWWIRKFGTTKIIILGLLAYTIQGTSYSLLYHPWLSIIIQATIVFSFHLLWVAVVVHSRQIAPVGLAATLNAVAGTVHFGIGRSGGVAIGGLLMNYLGIRITYGILAIFSLITAILYSIFLYTRYLFSIKKSGVYGKNLQERKSMNKKDDQEI